MRMAALLLSILGGTIVFFVAGPALTAGAYKGYIIVALQRVAISFSILGIVGGALSMKKPRIGGLILIMCPIGGFITGGLSGDIIVGAAYFLGGPFLFLAGILALIASRGATRP